MRAAVLLAPQLAAIADRRVGGQAGPHQLLVRRGRAREQGKDAVQERVLVQPAGGREQENVAHSTVGERAVGRQLGLAEPPGRALRVSDPDQGRVVLAPQLLAQEHGQQRGPTTLDAVGHGGSPPPRSSSARRRHLPADEAWTRRRSRPVRSSSSSTAQAMRDRPAGSRGRGAGPRGPLDRPGQFGIGEVAVGRAQAQGRGRTASRSRSSADAAEVEHHRIPGPPRLARDGVDELEIGRGPGHGHREHPVRVVALEQDREPATGLQRPGRRGHGVPEHGHLRPVGPRRAAEQRFEAEGLGRFPAGSHAVARYSKTARPRSPGRRRADDQVDALRRQVLADDRRRHRGSRAGWRPPSRRARRGRRRSAPGADRGRAPQRGAHVLVGSLEQAPHVHLAVVPRGGLADVAAADPQRGHRPGSRSGGWPGAGSRRGRAGTPRRAAGRGTRRRSCSRWPGGRTGCARCTGRGPRPPRPAGRRAQGTDPGAAGRRGPGGHRSRPRWEWARGAPWMRSDPRRRPWPPVDPVPGPVGAAVRRARRGAPAGARRRPAARR